MTLHTAGYKGVPVLGDTVLCRNFTSSEQATKSWLLQPDK